MSASPFVLVVDNPRSLALPVGHVLRRAGVFSHVVGPPNRSGAAAIFFAPDERVSIEFASPRVTAGDLARRIKSDVPGIEVLQTTEAAQWGDAGPWAGGGARDSEPVGKLESGDAEVAEIKALRSADAIVRAWESAPELPLRRVLPLLLCETKADAAFFLEDSSARPPAFVHCTIDPAPGWRLSPKTCPWLLRATVSGIGCTAEHFEPTILGSGEPASFWQPWESALSVFARFSTKGSPYAMLALAYHGEGEPDAVGLDLFASVSHQIVGLLQKVLLRRARR